MNTGNPLHPNRLKSERLSSCGGSVKVEITKEALEELYVRQKLSTYAIAKRYNCWDTTICSKLKAFGIKRRNSKKKKIFPRELLEELYLNKKYSISRIAKELGCGHATIWHRLEEYNIPKRRLKRYQIGQQELHHLYLNKKFSQSRIAKLLDCSPWVISNKLNKFELQKRNASEACMKYERRDFSNNPIEKAYLIGFRLGDIHGKRRSIYSIGLNSSTTKREQLELMCSLFEKYAHVQTSASKGTFSFSCILNNSFSFLEPKEDRISNWILGSQKNFFSFLAGYTDAEGNIGVYSGRARYRLGSYDKNILKQVYNKLNALNIKTNIRLESPKGYTHGWVVNHHDFWRISINYKDSLFRLFKKLEPHLKHKKRIRDMKKARKMLWRD
jgi:hypothetical protein